MLLGGDQLSNTRNLTAMQPPKTGTTIAHIGIAVRGLDESVSFYRDVLGLGTVTLEDADGARIAGFSAGSSLVELLEAVSPDSPIAKFIEKRGPGLHHMCFAVDDLDATLDRCRAHGVRLIDEQRRLMADGQRVAF